MLEPCHLKMFIYSWLAPQQIPGYIWIQAREREGGSSEAISDLWKLKYCLNTTFSLWELPAVTVALWCGVCIQESSSMMLLLSNHWHLHTWMCLKIKPTGYSNWAAGAKQGIGQGWSMGKKMLEGKEPRLVSLCSWGSTGWGHHTRHQHKVVSHKVRTAKQTENIHGTAKQKALVILSARYSSHQHLPV